MVQHTSKHDEAQHMYWNSSQIDIGARSCSPPSPVMTLMGSERMHNLCKSVLTQLSLVH